MEHKVCHLVVAEIYRGCDEIKLAKLLHSVFLVLQISLKHRAIKEIQVGFLTFSRKGIILFFCV